MTSDQVGLFDECFTHVAEDGTQTTWASSALYTFCEANPDKCAKVRVPVEEEHARYCHDNRGVERDRLESLIANPDYLKKPILFVHMPDDSHLLVDGTHRYVCYFALSMESIGAYIVDYAHAKAFIVVDAPTLEEKALMSHSGITALRKMGLM